MKKPPQKVPARVWRIGDKVTKAGMQGVYEITRVSPVGTEVDLCLVGTDNFELFRVSVEMIALVE